MIRKETAMARFVRYIKPGRGDCIVWTAYTARRNGYAYFTVANRTTLAHRYVFEFFKGPIPEGFTIDHLCRNTSCVNPFHLEAVTRGENVLRGVGPLAINAKKTHCLNGHEFTEANTQRVPNGRNCRMCANERAKLKRRQAKKAKP
jgi:hypothetical protein